MLTMQNLSYQDDPRKIEKVLEDLSERDRSLFDLGYACAIYGLLEQLTESKSVLMNAMMDHHKGTPEHLQLRSKLRVLDLYDNHYSQRAKNFESQMA